MNYQYFECSNGLRIIHKETSSSVAHFGITILTGTRDEAEKERGVAHFIEHMLFKRTKKRTVFQILNCLENVGGEINAFTSKEETCIYAAFLPQYYEKTIELFADILLQSIFPESEIEKEKGVVIDEINSYKDSPYDEIYEDFEEIVFPNHSMGKTILGKTSDIKKISRNTILKFISNNYQPDKIVISSVGNIKLDKIVKLTHKYFSEIPFVKNNSKKKSPQNYQSIEKKIFKKNFQSHCIIGNKAYNLYDSSKLPFVLLNNILGGPTMNSRLSMALREKNGLCYNLESSFNPFSDCGYFSIYFGTDFENVDKSLNIIYRELTKLKTQKLSKIQLSRAKKQILGQLAISLESSSNEMIGMGKNVLIYGFCDNFNEISNKIDKITEQEIIDAANEIFVFEKMSTILYMNNK